MDLRVIATTNRDLAREVAEGRFREDLYYRLNVFPIALPPLRERPQDIPVLAEHFLKKHAARNGRAVRRIHPEAMALLQREPWRGNVRELENAIERALLLADGEELLPRHFVFDRVVHTGDRPCQAVAGTTVWEMERDLILKTLEELGGNRTHAAQRLGISIRTLRNKIREYRQAGYPVP